MMAFSWGRESEQFSQSVLTERSITMPLRDGLVDWATLGNVLRSKLLGEVLLASYVDSKHCERSVDFDVDTDWKYSYEEKDVVVLQKQNTANSNFFCYMGRGVIEAPMEEIAEFLKLPEAPLSYDHHVVESRHIDVVSQTNDSKNIIVYYRSEVTRCLFKTVRDMVFLSSRSSTGGKHILASMSVDHPLCPPVNGMKRVQLQPGCGWLLEPYRGDETRTLVSYSLQVDLIGIPPVVSNRVLKRQPLNIYYLRKHLLESPHRKIPQSSTLLSQSHDTAILQVRNVSPDVSGRHFEEGLPVNSFTTATLKTVQTRQKRQHGSCSPLDTENREFQEELNNSNMHLSVEVSTHHAGMKTNEGRGNGEGADLSETKGKSKEDHIHTDGKDGQCPISTTEEPDVDKNKNVNTVTS